MREHYVNTYSALFLYRNNSTPEFLITIFPSPCALLPYKNSPDPKYAIFSTAISSQILLFLPEAAGREKSHSFENISPICVSVVSVHKLSLPLTEPRDSGRETPRGADWQRTFSVCACGFTHSLTLTLACPFLGVSRTRNKHLPGLLSNSALIPAARCPPSHLLEPPADELCMPLSPPCFDSLFSSQSSL